MNSSIEIKKGDEENEYRIFYNDDFLSLLSFLRIDSIILKNKYNISIIWNKTFWSNSSKLLYLTNSKSPKKGYTIKVLPSTKDDFEKVIKNINDIARFKDIYGEIDETNASDSKSC